jgi:TolB-like protein/AraC-like DNA-binding protein/Tfp pilus assembly protein PilF
MNTGQSMDQAFINKVTHFIEVNLGNEQFGVKELAKKMGMSRSNLHRKLQTIKGKSASRFIREYRLEKAMAMLKKDVATASEIAYSVGFGSPSYFNKCFHKYYGYPPGEAKFRRLKPLHQEDIPAPIIRTDLSRKSLGLNKIVLVSSIAILSVITISYLFYFYSTDNFTTKKTEVMLRDKSIAVLPCMNLSGEEENQYFADGQMEAILNHLTRIAELKVISRTTMLSYRGTTMSVPEIAKELGVKYVLELSAQKSGQEVNITAQLVDADTDRHLWSNNYIRDLTDIFTIQTEIAKSVARELRAKITPNEQAVIESIPTSDLTAYDFYLKGLDYDNRSLQKDFQYAAQMFERSVEIDPEFTLAWVGLASVSSNDYWYNYEGSEKHKNRIKKYLDKAISLDPDLLEVKLAEGIYYYRTALNYPKAIQILEKLKTQYPNNYQLYAWSGYVYRRMGRFEKFKEYMDKSILLFPSYWQAYFATGETLIMLRRYKEAEAYLKTAIELNPAEANNYILLARLYLITSDVNKARTLLNNYKNITDPVMFKIRSNTELMNRKYELAIQILESSPHELIVSHESYTTKSLQLALIYDEMSNKVQANTHFQGARQVLEEKLIEFPNDSRIYSSLGIVYAGLGMIKESLDAGNRALSLMNISIDALRGVYRELDMAKILMMIGDHDEAIKKLEFLLQQYSFISVELLKIDPFWDPLRETDSFKALIENPKYQINLMNI